MTLIRIKRAAAVLGVSEDTVRRWAEAGKFGIETDAAGKSVIPGEQLAQFCQERAFGDADGPHVGQSVRNRFTGVVIELTRDRVMAQVVVQAGPHRIVSLISREACDELALEVGSIVAAAVKSTNVAIELPAK